ncbi:hypothetical protein, partial [Rathayibacter rathayi]|uniref:hypothetical protein n=1 Tax=Rathayibacter rathayi TaxID=33887 RepID=UPI001CA4AE06
GRRRGRRLTGYRRRHPGSDRCAVDPAPRRRSGDLVGHSAGGHLAVWSQAAPPFAAHRRRHGVRLRELAGTDHLDLVDPTWPAFVALLAALAR